MFQNDSNRAAKPSQQDFLLYLCIAVVAVAMTVMLWGFQSHAAGASESPRNAAMEKVRVGTYDSRAIAVAYVRSERSAAKLNELIQQRAEAEKKGDKKRIKDLTQQGESLQVRRHLQAFSNAPIEDILETLHDHLPRVAQQANVIAITAAIDWHDPSLELIDVTNELVQFFSPDEQTLRIIADLRARQPEAIELVAKIPAKN